MVAYSFQKRFVQPILDRTKLHTVRTDRKRHARPGEQLQLYTGMRTKHCRLIGKPRCSAVRPILMLLGYGIAVKIGDGLDRRLVEPETFARADGFESWDNLLAFWEEQHPGVRRFEGVIIFWEWP